LAVDALLTGRVVQRGDTIQVSADLTNVQDNTEIWGEQYERKSSDIIALQRQIAGDIAEKLRSKLSGTEKQQVTKQGTQNPEAYQLYVKGRYYWTKRTNANIKTAISYFNQAIDKDPGYAQAYAGLADAYSVLSNFGGDPRDVLPKSQAAAEKALELDPTLARPHADLGMLKMTYSWDFSGGETEFRKAIELDPSDATAHQWFAEALAYIGGPISSIRWRPSSVTCRGKFFILTANLTRQLRWRRKPSPTIPRLAQRTWVWQFPTGAGINIRKPSRSLQPQLAWRTTGISSRSPPPWTRAFILVDGRARCARQSKSRWRNANPRRNTLSLTQSLSSMPI
jgi:hypothetical protein